MVWAQVQLEALEEDKVELVLKSAQDLALDMVLVQVEEALEQLVALEVEDQEKALVWDLPQGWVLVQVALALAQVELDMVLAPE